MRPGLRSRALLFSCSPTIPSTAWWRRSAPAVGARRSESSTQRSSGSSEARRDVRRQRNPPRSTAFAVHAVGGLLAARPWLPAVRDGGNGRVEAGGGECARKARPQGFRDEPWPGGRQLVLLLLG